MKYNTQATDDAPLLTTARAAEVLNVSGRYLEMLRVRGGGPPFVSLGRTIRYRRADINAWLDSRTRRSTSERLG
jgi:excisionase family DNA binding protein